MVAISKLVTNGLYLANTQSVLQDLATPQQGALEQYNIVNFLGGAAPYRQWDGYGISPDLPDLCTLEQVQLISRHGERYPTKNAGAKYEKVIDKFLKHGNKGNFSGSLEFLNTYVYFGDNGNSSQYALETTNNNSVGPFAGLDDAHRHGIKFREKYGTLYNGSAVLPVFTSNSNRVYHTSVAFTQGFLNQSLDAQLTSSQAHFNVIKEDESSGANSLTPADSCTKYDKDVNNDKLAKYNDDYLKTILDRFQKESPSVDLSHIKKDDINELFGLCAYEINVRGLSPWCSLFNNDEFLYNGYGNDLSHYYSTGPGNPLSAPIGSVLLNASLELLNKESSNKVWLSFTHDSDIDNFLSALGLLMPTEDLSIDKIDFARTYVHGKLVPQGARIYLERFLKDGESYVRYLVNESVAPLSDCYSGPGFSCPLSDFNSYITDRLSKYNYTQQCDVDSKVPQELSFYWDYGHSNYTAPLKL